jgi:hypothetical protein
MGSLLFVVFWALGYRDLANDYQHLPLLVSLDTIAATYWITRSRKKADSAS